MVLLALTMATVGAAEAHTVRYIASNGSDANGCSRAAPCLTLQRGVNRTAAGSELIILDSGDFGDGATIDKSITISASGVSATIGGGITIDGADATVVLRGLRLNGAGAPVTGINIRAAASVHVEDCEVQNFGGAGISINNTAGTKLFVSDTVVRNNSFNGLFFAAGADGRLAVDNSRFERNGVNSSYSGIKINSGEARISRTIAAGNSGHGIGQFGGEADIIWTTATDNGGAGYRVQGQGYMIIEESVSRGNDYGLHVSQSGTVAVLSNSVVTNNGIGLSASSRGRLWTRSTSTVSGNTTNVSGPLTPFEGN
jgi:hypothetical protein